jgi:group I intron endonuclease
MERYGFIYITTNTINGKRYIGQTTYKRGERHYKSYLGSGKYLHEAIKKHGRENFTRETIFECFYMEDLNWAECYFIKEFDAVKSREFYNVSPGGRASLGFTGKKHTESRNRKVSQKLMGHSVDERTREAVSAAGKLRTGSNNPRALRINIYNADGSLVYECHGNLKKVCSDNDLPFPPLKGSYMNSGKPIFMSGTPKNLRNLEHIKYKGWFARIVDNTSTT